MTKGSLLRTSALVSVVAMSAALSAAPASATAQTNVPAINIPAQPVDSALRELARSTGANVLFSPEAVDGLSAHAVSGRMTPAQAARELIADTKLEVISDASGALVVRKTRGHAVDERAEERPMVLQVAQAARPIVSLSSETVTVTAQKIEENIQNVPIAVSAFSDQELQAQKIEGGPDLLKSIPNMTFSKNNFSGYNVQIRGVGTKAVSVTTDPAVAVSFNDTALIRNRFFEQEFFDVQRVEILRGPQGTLYGRNATGGVVNIISAKPTDQFEGEIKGEVGNYNSKRLRGFINVPIIDDKLDIRIAGSLTKRDGYDYDSLIDKHVNGRDLWSARATVGFKPTEWLQGNLVWEHFNEDDDRSRTGKQLCHRDPGPTSIDGLDLSQSVQPTLTTSYLSQGCLPGSLYDAGAYGTPNGLSIPFVLSLAAGLPPIGYDPATGKNVNFIDVADPYGNQVQSKDLRTISSQIIPVYRAKSDVVELNFDVDIASDIRFTSETAYDSDQYYSSQDYNRFTTYPVFNNSAGGYLEYLGGGPTPYTDVTPGGVFCDPQLGCSDTIVGEDLSKAHSQQISQEIRLSSSYSGPLNFSAGANYLHYKTVEDYYVFFNAITLNAMTAFNGLFSLNPSLNIDCTRDHGPVGVCVPIDANPINQITGLGHNYYHSANPYSLTSWAGFGELYYQVDPDVKLTGGLRWTDDRKTFTPIPSETLLSDPANSTPEILSLPFGNLFFGLGGGYPALPPVIQHWSEVTGRAVAQWTPKVSFTDQSMFYASYSRGYKGGGANPPAVGGEAGSNEANHPTTFKPEFINAYEAGTKNTLDDGQVTVNGDAFFYDYKNYQISKIVDRTAINENFDARIWGAELEASWEPLAGLRFNFSGGAQDSALASGSKSIDIIDRTGGNSDWMIVKPFVLDTSNCIAPTAAVKAILQKDFSDGPSAAPYPGSNLNALCPGGGSAGDYSAGTYLSSYYGVTYNPMTDAPNEGAGFSKDLGGNDLPNTPHFTLSFGAQYTIPVSDSWAATLRGDAYWQSNSWARVYNDRPYDVLHGWSNFNVTFDIARSDGLQIEAYVKNLFNTTALTDAFLNSDDSALTTNVFTTDPRLIGFSITKSF